MSQENFEMTDAFTNSVEKLKISSGQTAKEKSGAQPEFIAANQLQANSLNNLLILRAGNPPQYNHQRSSKSGYNLSKTSNQGVFQGYLVTEERFGRITGRDADGPKFMEIHKKDKEHMKENVFHEAYQHRMPLDLAMEDILRVIGPNGDMHVLGYENGQLRLGYNENKGGFDGQIVLDFEKNSREAPKFYSRPWDKPEHQKDWDPEKNVIRKPEALKLMPDEDYKKYFHSLVDVQYTEDQKKDPNPGELKPAEVFANRVRTPKEFCDTLEEILDLDVDEKLNVPNALIEQLRAQKDYTALLEILKETNGGAEIIQAVYNKSGKIVTGDWDGMALGHPPGIASQFRQVYNTFDTKTDQKPALLAATQDYFDKLRTQALGKITKQDGSHFKDYADYLQYLKENPEFRPAPPLSAFEKSILMSPENIGDFISPFALSRAGCITPHEFLFQQILNSNYRSKENLHYGESFDMEKLQNVFNSLKEKHPTMATHQEIEDSLKNEYRNLPQIYVQQMVDHLSKHLHVAHHQNAKDYKLPHPQYDANVHELYQHGFDMRNPYGSNLDGAWLMVTPNGGTYYGNEESQLTELLMVPGILESNLMDINWGANMSKGWDKVVCHQLELGQDVPNNTLMALAAHLNKENKSLSDFIKDPKKVLDAEGKVVQAITSLDKEDTSVYKDKGIYEPAKDWLSGHQKALMTSFKNFVKPAENKEVLGTSNRMGMSGR
jgi:hypothetical protein